MVKVVLLGLVIEPVFGEPFFADFMIWVVRSPSLPLFLTVAPCRRSALMLPHGCSTPTLLSFQGWMSIIGALTAVGLLCRHRFDYLSVSPLTPLRELYKVVTILSAVFVANATVTCVLAWLLPASAFLWTAAPNSSVAAVVR
jgi:hypothetical protein